MHGIDDFQLFGSSGNYSLHAVSWTDFACLVQTSCRYGYVDLHIRAIQLKWAISVFRYLIVSIFRENRPSLTSIIHVRVTTKRDEGLMLRCDFGRRPRQTSTGNTIDSCSHCACATTNLRHVVVKLASTVRDHSTTVPHTTAWWWAYLKLDGKTAISVYRGYFVTHQLRSILQTARWLWVAPPVLLFGR